MSSPRRHLDPRADLVLDTHDLLRQAGAMREIRQQVEAPEGWHNEMIKVPAGSPISLDVRLEAVGEGVLVTGQAQVTATGKCGRCLDSITRELVVEIQELYAYPDSDTDGEETSRLDSELLDLEPLVRDEVLLGLPFLPVCREDCAGLCARCGINLNVDPEHTHGGPVDPRWADLAGWQAGSDVGDN